MAENVPHAVSRFRFDGEFPIVRDALIDHRPGSGFIIPVKFKDGTSWSVKAFSAGVDEDESTRLADYEGAMLRRLNQIGFSWAPKFIGEELSCKNPIGFPYIVYESFPGRPMVWNDTTPNRDVRMHLVRGLARILAELLELTRSDYPDNKFLFGDFVSSILDERLLRTWRDKLPGGANTARQCLLIRKALIDDERMGRIVNSNSISHNSLTPSNILVDEDYNITGIVGWDSAVEQPCQFAAMLPRLFRATDDGQVSDDIHFGRHEFVRILTTETPLMTMHPDIVCMIEEVHVTSDGRQLQQHLELTVDSERFTQFVTGSAAVEQDAVQREWTPLFGRQTMRVAGVEESQFRDGGWI